MFTESEKKAIALAIHEGVEFFIHNGVAYEGSEEAERDAYNEYKEQAGESAGTFTEWVETECTPLPDYTEWDADGMLVLTDEEADERTADDIKETLWAFNPEFVAAYCPEGVDADTIRAIQDNGRCESNNPVMFALVGENIDSLVADAIGCDGRGHFLSSYDGEENEVNLFDVTGKNEYFFIYKN